MVAGGAFRPFPAVRRARRRAIRDLILLFCKMTGPVDGAKRVEPRLTTLRLSDRPPPPRSSMPVSGRMWGQVAFRGGDPAQISEINGLATSGTPDSSHTII